MSSNRKDTTNPTPTPPAVWFGGGLYPSVMISDSFNTIGHLLAARMCYVDYGNTSAAIGFLTVSVAAAVGTYRFGFNEGFDRMNGDLADLAAFVGLPLVGLEYFKRLKTNPLGNIELTFETTIATVLLLLTLEAITRSVNVKIRELVKTLANVLCFVAPVLYGSYTNQNYNALYGIIIFVVAAVVIEPDRHRCILGLRREDWFHYMIGVAAPLIAQGLQDECSLPYLKEGTIKWKC